MLFFCFCFFFNRKYMYKRLLYIISHTTFQKVKKKIDVFVLSQKCYRLHTIFIKHSLGIAYFVNKKHSFQNCTASFCLIVS